MSSVVCPLRGSTGAPQRRWSNLRRPHPATARLEVRAGSRSKEDPVWKFGFQMNERYIQWGESGQGRFLKLYCGEKLGWTSEQVDEEIQSLMALLPGLEMRFERMKADLLLRLLTHRDTIAASMITLRRELPDADIAAMVARYPALVTDFSEEELVASIAAVREALPGVQEIGGMLQLEPRILTVEVQGLLAEIERLLPGQDPKKLLVQNPSSYMDMLSQGLRSSLLDEPGLQTLKNHSKG